MIFHTQIQSHNRPIDIFSSFTAMIHNPKLTLLLILCIFVIYQDKPQLMKMIQQQTELRFKYRQGWYKNMNVSMRKCNTQCFHYTFVFDNAKQCSKFIRMNFPKLKKINIELGGQNSHQLSLYDTQWPQLQQLQICILLFIKKSDENNLNNGAIIGNNRPIQINLDNSMRGATNKYLKMCNWNKLQRLNLSNCNIGVEGCKFFCEGKLTKLTYLSLQNNAIGDKGCTYLSKNQWYNLQTLLLNKNNIAEQGCIYLSRGPWRNLRKLVLLKGNHINKNAFKVLIKTNWRSSCFQVDDVKDDDPVDKKVVKLMNRFSRIIKK